MQDRSKAYQRCHLQSSRAAERQAAEGTDCRGQQEPLQKIIVASAPWRGWLLALRLVREDYLLEKL